MTAKTRRTNILKTAKSLLARTVKNGCTEAEAAEARLKLIAIMRNHNLTFSEIKSGKRHKTIHFYQHTANKRFLLPSAEQAQTLAPIFLAYDRHEAIHEQADRKRNSRLHPPVCTYRIYGLNFIKSPWRETHDYSRIRAVAREISLRWPQYASQIVVDGPHIGECVPIIKFRDGVELRWKRT